MEKAERGGGASGMGGAATSSTNGCNHSHTASQLHCRACTHRVGQRGRGSEGVGVSITCVQITRCARCAPTTQITHPLCHSSMQMACESAERKKRGGQLIHSLPPPPHIQLAHTTLHLLSFPPSPSISLSSTPAIHAHTITSTDLSDNHQHTTAPLTHTHTSQTSPVACASAQRKHSSSSSSSPTTRVPRHHHQPISSSTCMQHL